MPPKSRPQSPTPKLVRPATRDHLTSGKRPLRVSHEVVLDNELADQLVAARGRYELAEARFKAKPTDKAITEEFEAAQAAYDEARDAAVDVVFEVVFEGMGRHRFDLLKRKHPPTDEDKKMAARVGVDEKQLEFSPTTFPPAVIAASMIAPEMTEDEVRAEIWDSDAWNEAETQGLYLAAMKANQARSSVDLGKASGATRASAPSRPSATGSVSLAASS